MTSAERPYKQIVFPPLTKEQEKELEALEGMKDEDIDTEDMPEADFSDASFRYAAGKSKREVPKTSADPGCLLFRS